MKKNKKSSGENDPLKPDIKSKQPIRPDKNIPAKPDKNPDPTKKVPGIKEPEKEEPPRIDEPNINDPTRIDDPPPNA